MWREMELFTQKNALLCDVSILSIKPDASALTGYITTGLLRIVTTVLLKRLLAFVVMSP
jgi:hypothetical protein